jgi:hypothetical protein
VLTDEQKESVKDIVKAILAENKPAEQAAPSQEDIEKAKAKKSEDNDADDADDKKEKKDKADKKDMKKSEEAAAVEAQPADEIGTLSDEEKELVKAWRASKDEPAEEVAKSQAAEQAPKQDEEIKKALDAQKTENETLKKSLAEQSEMIKSLTEKVEKMESQPAYDKKAVTKLEPIEKSQPETEKASKRQVIDALLTLQQEGDKDVNSHVISKYEATNQLSKSLQEKVKTQILKGK